MHSRSMEGVLVFENLFIKPNSAESGVTHRIRSLVFFIAILFVCMGSLFVFRVTLS